MSDTQQLPLSVQPVISYPREAQVGKTYLMTIDLQPSGDEWLYEEEEYPIYCMLETSPLFSSKPVGEPAVVLHRFGGSYGAAKFLLKAAPQEVEGKIKITLVNQWGVPIRVLRLDKVRVTRESDGRSKVAVGYENTEVEQLSSEIQQVLGGNKNQPIGRMSRDSPFGTVEGSVSIYNYYYRESTATDGDVNLPCPYRGFFHFSPNDAEFFFGREVFVDELFEATERCNFIPVVGASGSGKSSVVLAGLVPRLQNTGHWLFTHFRPDSDPFHALALALVPLYTSNLDHTDKLIQARQLSKALSNSEILLADVFAQIHQNHPTDRVLLIADQFEEIYTLCSDEKVRHSFLDTLLASFPSFPSQSQHKRILVATMRADFLGNALLYPPFGDLLRTDIKLIRSMNYEELEQVIVLPSQKLGVTFQEGLVKRILDDVESEPGNLPLLEFALTELWKRQKGKQLTHKAYEDIGEVKGALARHADEKYSNLTDGEKKKVRRIFIQLVHPGQGTEDTRRLATKAELPEASWGLVKQLADARLVVTSYNSENQETVEVVHEALIRNWNQLRHWIEMDRSFRAWQDRLRIAIYQWEQTQRDEGALLRGVLLADAEAKLKQRPEDLTAEEQEFIQASLALRDRENHPWWRKIFR